MGAKTGANKQTCTEPTKLNSFMLTAVKAIKNHNKMAP